METPKKFGEGLQLTPQEMAAQLRKPEGETGIKVGEQMNIGNEHICKNTYLVSNLQENETVLEIGMGNGLFVHDYLSSTSKTKYVGLDFSTLMVSESIKNNKKLIQSNRVSFIEASIEKLPFEDNSYDKIVTANTLYFWPNPKENTQELLRVLKPNGLVVIGYRHKEFMDKLELANYGFTKYTPEEVEQLLITNGFEKVKTDSIEEPELYFGGTLFSMKGYYTKTQKRPIN